MIKSCCECAQSDTSPESRYGTTSRTVENRRQWCSTSSTVEHRPRLHGRWTALCRLRVFIVGTDTSSGARTRDDGARFQEDGHALRGCLEQPRGCVTWGMNAFVCTLSKEGVLQLLLDKVAKRMSFLKDKTGKIYDRCHRHRAAGANGVAEKAVPTVRGFGRTSLAVLKDKIPSFDVNDTFTDAATDNRPRSVGSHSIQLEKRHTNDSVREDSWTRSAGKRSCHWVNKFSLVAQEPMSISFLQPWVTGLWLRRRHSASDEQLIGCSSPPSSKNQQDGCQKRWTAMLFTPWSPHLNLPGRPRDSQRPAYTTTQKPKPGDVRDNAEVMPSSQHNVSARRRFPEHNLSQAPQLLPCEQAQTTPDVNS